MKIRAPAKINLYLRVTGRRKDGYHLIDTVMVPVSLYDELDVRGFSPARRAGAHAAQIEVACSDPRIPTGPESIAYRAADLILRRARSRDCVSIRIRKNIPVGAGLGGGSSDAAAILIALNRLFRLGYSPGRLEKLGLLLGADVPFFIRRRPARARGIGERLTPLGKLPPLWSIILYPGFPVSTAWVYGNTRLKLTKLKVNTSIIASLGDFAALRKLLVNDLEAVTIRRYPRIGMLKEKLRCAGAGGVLMSGSGSSVFGVFSNRQQAFGAFKRLKKEEGVQAFLVRVVN